MIWLMRENGEKLDLLLVSSLVASIMQIYQDFHYINELSITYRTTKVLIALEMLQLGSNAEVPFRLVLCRWAKVGFSPLRDDLRKTEDETSAVEVAMSA